MLDLTPVKLHSERPTRQNPQSHPLAADNHCFQLKQEWSQSDEVAVGGFRLYAKITSPAGGCYKRNPWQSRVCSPSHPPSWPPTLIKGCKSTQNVSDYLPAQSSCQVIWTWRIIGQKLICARSCTDHLFSAPIRPIPLPKHFFFLIHAASVWSSPCNPLPTPAKQCQQALISHISPPSSPIWDLKVALDS